MKLKRLLVSLVCFHYTRLAETISNSYLFCGHQVLNTAHVSQCYHPATTSCLDRIPGSNVAFIFQNFKNDLVLILCFLVKTHGGYSMYYSEVNFT